MHQSLSGKKMLYLITGATRGIGKFLADILVSSGNTVFGTYFSTAPEHNSLNHEVKSQLFLSRVDIRNPEQATQWVESITRDSADNIVVINCAGVNYNAAIQNSDPILWHDVLDVNLFGVYNVIRAVIPYMRNIGFGRIINLSSVVPRIGVYGTSAYAASKAGLWGLAKAVAVENAKYGITINTINLGYFNIGMIAEVPKDYLSDIVKKIPQGSLGDPMDILKAVQYLVSATNITGAEININGGLV